MMSVSGMFSKVLPLALLPHSAMAQAQVQSPKPPTDGLIAPDFCAKEGKVRFLCGLAKPEDVLQVPGSPWVVSSGFDGGIEVIDSRSMRHMPLFPAAGATFQFDRKRVTGSACTSPGFPNRRG